MSTRVPGSWEKMSFEGIFNASCSSFHLAEVSQERQQVAFKGPSWDSSRPASLLIYPNRYLVERWDLEKTKCNCSAWDKCLSLLCSCSKMNLNRAHPTWQKTLPKNHQNSIKSAFSYPCTGRMTQLRCPSAGKRGIPPARAAGIVCSGHTQSRGMSAVPEHF